MKQRAQQTDCESDRTDPESLGDDHGRDASAVGAERGTHPDLANPLRHREGDHAVEPHAGEHDGEQRESGKQLEIEATGGQRRRQRSSMVRSA